MGTHWWFFNFVVVKNALWSMWFLTFEDNSVNSPQNKQF